MDKVQFRGHSFCFIAVCSNQHWADCRYRDRPVGCAVKGVSVTVADERTNQERTAITNDDGNYAFTGLQPSSYTLRASQTGFSNTEVKAINLQVGQEIRRNLELAVRGTSSVVNVASGAIDAIDQSDAKIGVNVSEREVGNLPLNGRQVSQLYLLTPGAVNSAVERMTTFASAVDLTSKISFAMTASRRLRSSMLHRVI
jgi:Carboxypeptidase regulatory-like domain